MADDNTATTSITINALPTATINYAGSPYCASGIATVTQTGTAGGTYTSTAGLTINAATGDIDLVASTPGTYTVTYSFTSGTCSNTTTASITITALPTATIAYTGYPYCASGIATVTQTGTAGGTYTSTAGLTINAATGDVDLVASTPGTYTVTYSFTSGGCSNTATTSITINTLPTATIIMQESLLRERYCDCYTNRNSRWNYISTAGLTINAATGDIDLVASTPGTYTVTYSFTSGGCNNTATTSITINALPTATINYAGSPYCASGVATVTQTGTAGGTYTSTAGLTINAATGDIDLVASTPGTYTVTYSFTSGGCSNTATTSITINALPTATINYAGSPYCASGVATATKQEQPVKFIRCWINDQCSDRRYRSGSKYAWNLYSHVQLHQRKMQQHSNNKYHDQYAANSYYKLCRKSLLRYRHCLCHTNRNSRWNLYFDSRINDQCSDR